MQIELTRDEQRIVLGERESHPRACVRRRRWALWLLPCGSKREQAAKILGVARSTVQRDVRAYRTGGLEALRKSGREYRPTSELAKQQDQIRQSLEQQPARTIAEACQRIAALTGVERKPTQVRRFVTGLGLKWQRVRAIPVPPKKKLVEHAADRAAFLDEERKPALDAAPAGQGHVFFVDAAHFVFGTFPCRLWSFARLFIRAASGRQRFNVLGAGNAVSRTLPAVTNTTVVDTETRCELLREIAAQGLTGPIALVLDNARYQRNAVGIAWAGQLGIRRRFLPSYSPNLNLIERLWKFTKRRSLYGRYHPTFTDFRAAIEQTLAGIPTQHAADLASLRTLNFQRFENVSLMAA